MEKIYIVKHWDSDEEWSEIYGVYESFSKAKRAITRAIIEEHFPWDDAFHIEEMRIDDTWRKVITAQKTVKEIREEMKM